MVNKNSKRETWSFKPLNDYLDLLTDYDANGSFADMAANVHTEWGHGYAWYVRATDLEQNLSMADVRYADEYSYNFLEKTSLFGGELLMAKRGEIGKIYFFQMSIASKIWRSTGMTPISHLKVLILLLKSKNESIGLTVSASDISGRWLLRSSVGGIFLRTAELKSLKQLSALSLLHFAWVILMHPMAAVIIIELHVRCM